MAALWRAHWRTASAVVGGILLVVALYMGHSNDQRLAGVAKRTTGIACNSRADLNKLLDDLGDIVVPKESLSDPRVTSADKARAQAFIARIHAYTSKNPTCKLLP